ncbi:Arabinose 5-phosphate isomerase KdsD [Candidatus Hartigia pinicola]|nr:Arabinose 5-phosphate isomerase KdsD [Candidatus Hartigia pinicola]
MSNINFQQIGQEVLHIESEGLKNLKQYINDDFNRACQQMFVCQGKIIVMGMGKSGHIGRKIAATFSGTGTSSFFVHPGEASHGDLGMITNKDTVLAISNSGEAPEILALLPLLKRIEVPLICMTNNPKSNMGKNADIHLCIKVPKEACPLGLAPTTSTTATLVMGDALAIALLTARGFTYTDFALAHPGGVLGRKLLLVVRDLMTIGDDIPNIAQTATLPEALLEMTRKKMGMTVICDHQRNIVGIFTDGDLRRIFDMGIDFNNVKISDVMTSGGIQVTANILAVEAMNLMKSKHVTSLIVSENNKLVGVLHMHNILDIGVV